MSTIGYDEMVAIARDLIGDGENGEYARGCTELIADCFGTPGVFLADRKDEVARDLAGTSPTYHTRRGT